MATKTAGKDLSQAKVREALHPLTETKTKKTEEEAYAEFIEPRSRGRGRSPAEVKASYSRYRANKKMVLALEERNFEHLVLFPASDKDANAKRTFYNMGGNSAIIFCYEIGPRIHRKPALRRDMDLGPDRFNAGICSISNLEKLEKELGEIGIKRMKDHGDLIIFKLHRTYTKTEINEMLKEEQKRLDSLNKLIYAKVLYPDVHRLILELKKAVPAKVKNMDKTYREVIGVRVIDSMLALVRLYSQMAHGDLPEEEAARGMLLELDMMLAEVSIMNELKLWDVSACIRIADLAVRTRTLIKGKILSRYEVAG